MEFNEIVPNCYFPKQICTAEVFVFVSFQERNETIKHRPVKILEG